MALARDLSLAYAAHGQQNQSCPSGRRRHDREADAHALSVAYQDANNGRRFETTSPAPYGCPSRSARDALSPTQRAAARLGGRSLPAAELLGTLLACQSIASDIHG